MRFLDWLGANYIYYYKSAFISGISSELQSALANAKAAIVEGNSTALSAYTSGKAALDAKMTGSAGDLTIGTIAMPASPGLWLPAYAISPAYGESINLLSIQIDCTLPNSSNACGYIALMAGNDILATPSTLASMPYYSGIYGYQKITPFANITGATTITVSLPINAIIGAKGATVYLWETTEAGFSMDAGRALYRSF